MMPSMYRALILLLPVCLVLAAACGGDDGGEAREAPERSGASAGAPTATAAQVADLAGVAVPGYTAASGGETLLGASVIHTRNTKTAAGADLLVRANIAPCEELICASLNLAEYQSADVQANFKQVLPRAHIDNPDLRWEFGEVALSKDATGLYYYALSYVETKGADGGVSRSSANSYRAWYHNGGTYITLEVFSRSPVSPLSAADLEKQMTKAEAEGAAKAVFAALEPHIPR